MNIKIKDIFQVLILGIIIYFAILGALRYADEHIACYVIINSVDYPNISFSDLRFFSSEFGLFNNGLDFGKNKVQYKGCRYTFKRVDISHNVTFIKENYFTLQ